jgi:sugar/nucleoside kinase (ribokinase family)
MYDVYCYGAISMDISGQLETADDKGRQVVATDYRISPGGDAAIVAITLAGLGMKVALDGGPTGADPMGTYVRDKLKELGVHVLASTFGKTSVASILIHNREQRSIVTYHEDTEESEIPIHEDTAGNSKYIYADGCYARNSAIVGSIARTKHIPSLLNFDAASVTNVGTYETVIASEESSRIFSPHPYEAVKHIRELNHGLAIVTMGERGCVYSDDASSYIPALKVKAVDTTGAGAAFAAGFIFSRISGKSLSESIQFASAAGAYKAMARGSYRLCTPRDLEEFILLNK